MCSENVRLRLKVRADHNATGQTAWKPIQVDRCVADVVGALQGAGLDMLGSCCGHEQTEGHVHLADGRALLVLNPQQADWYFSKGIPLLRDCEVQAR